MKIAKSKLLSLAALVLLAAVIASLLLYNHFRPTAPAQTGTSMPEQQAYDSTTFAMDTVVTQTAYGPNAQAAMGEVNTAIQSFERQLSLFDPDSEIAAINTAAGSASGAEVSEYTAGLVRRSLTLSAQSENTFAITIAPLTLAWGITGDAPSILPQQEINALLPLVDDSLVTIQDNTVILPQQGMALDLGGIAKGEFCSIAMDIYEKHGVESALLWIGGNTYARGAKPDGTPWRIGFRDPYNSASSYIASFDLTDSTIAVSGGYERYFEEDGEQFIHIIDPRTGRPAQSDILSVGVIHPDGATADFYSTSLYVLGTEKALERMRGGITAILLDENNTLYVSQSLEASFTLYDGPYTLVYVEGS